MVLWCGFKIKRHTPLSKLMKAYCERQGLSMRRIRFRIDGEPINETDTPAQLEIEDAQLRCSSSRREVSAKKGTCYFTSELCLLLQTKKTFSIRKLHCI